MHTQISIGCTRKLASDGLGNLHRMEVRMSIGCAVAFQWNTLSRFNPLGLPSYNGRFSRVSFRGVGCGFVEGYGGEAEVLEQSKNVKCERDQITVASCSTEFFLKGRLPK